MATKGSKVEKSKVNSSQDYEVSYLAKKLGASSQAIGGAKRATGSNDRDKIEKYIKEKKKTK
ncbi:DUF3606 domain-containing protein [Pedobacter steynii]|uniref:DUF3606 domain-containing protein n=1 Tax=Pedobacter steynii TaxID=430522 RepID=A0A1D7QJN1_9SPHI|nr:DUF3606 domain-containing protein [Pedobacter steynii]AOM78886.1 hypothetical protein BFS30_17935 [Pedobacter steynii]